MSEENEIELDQSFRDSVATIDKRVVGIHTSEKAERKTVQYAYSF
jgi:hypothetical protein